MGVGTNMPYIIDPKTGKRIQIDALTGQPLRDVQSEQINQPTQQQGGSLLRNVGEAIVKPGVNYVEMVGEAFGQGIKQLVNRAEFNKLNRKVVDGTATEAETKRFLKMAEDLSKPIFMKEDELAKFSDPGSAALETAKRTAGGASYFIPGGGSVLSRVGAGVVSGGLSAFSEEDATLSDVALGMLYGGGTAGLFEAGSAGLKAGNKLIRGGTKKFGEFLTKRGADIKIGEYVKRIGGKPLQKEGGNTLLTSMKKVGIKPGDVDEIIAQSDELLEVLSPVVGQQMDDLTTKGVTISADDLTGPLKKQLKGRMLKSDKTRIQSIIDDIESFVGKKKKLTPAEFYDLKQRMGQLGRWNANAGADDLARGELWKDLYIKANQMTDDLLKNNGFDDFREINEIIHTAINAKAYAQRIGNKAPNINTLGLLDTITGVGGYGVAGVPGMLTSLAIRKAVNSPVASDIVGDVMGDVGNKLVRGAGGVAKKTATTGVKGQLMKNIAAVGAGGSAVVPTENEGNDAYGEPEQGGIDNSHANINTSNVDISQYEPEPMYGPDEFYEAMLMARMSGDVESFKVLKDLYEISLAEEERRTKPKETKKSDSEIARDELEILIEDAVSMLELGSINTGKINTPIEDVKATLGFGDKETLEFNTLLGNIKATLAKARAGTSFTENEEKLLEKYTPVPGDSRQQLETKLARLQRLFNKKKQK